ncbi:uncharacterized protein LOC132950333 isoform X2 [Metopolophium dirhodum]|uniref:uncharacterized protein LOC132950333 isoform X2 n=1 Tax=Metopolophium dirhodum TaxID=44670 RepID=UPI00298F6B2C|nr:uncharacterized protein LOC132950333 isoform X2 [Metopolophium dirhodum]
MSKTIAVMTLIVYTVLYSQKNAFYADAAPSITRDDLTAETEDLRKANPDVRQIETPLIDGGDVSTHSTSTMEGDMLSKGALSGLVPGGGGGGEATSAPATNTPAAGLGGSSLPFGGLPTGIPGAGGLPSSYLQGGDGGGQSPTLILGGFSAIVVPMRGLNMANMASMLSSGQQLGQMLPKPGVG